MVGITGGTGTCLIAETPPRFGCRDRKPIDLADVLDVTPWSGKSCSSTGSVTKAGCDCEADLLLSGLPFAPKGSRVLERSI